MKKLVFNNTLLLGIKYDCALCSREWCGWEPHPNLAVKYSFWR
jgi:hypothetical protein